MKLPDSIICNESINKTLQYDFYLPELLPTDDILVVGMAFHIITLIIIALLLNKYLFDPLTIILVLIVIHCYLCMLYISISVGILWYFIC